MCAYIPYEKFINNKSILSLILQKEVEPYNKEIYVMTHGYGLTIDGEITFSSTLRLPNSKHKFYWLTNDEKELEFIFNNSPKFSISL